MRPHWGRQGGLRTGEKCLSFRRQNTSTDNDRAQDDLTALIYKQLVLQNVKCKMIPFTAWSIEIYFETQNNNRTKKKKQKQLKKARNYLRNSLMPCSLKDPFRRANFILRALMAAMAGYPNPPIPKAFSRSDWAPASVHSHLGKQNGFQGKDPFQVKLESTSGSQVKRKRWYFKYFMEWVEKF